MECKATDRQTITFALVGLCPVLIVSRDMASGLLMAMAFIVVLVSSTCSVSLCRRYIAPEYSLALLLFISATWTACVVMLVRAGFYEVGEELGIYLPLLAMNSVILLSLQRTALLLPPLRSLFAGISMALPLSAVICVFGAMREFFGNGTLFEHTGITAFESMPALDMGFTGPALVNQPVAVLLALALLCALLRRTGSGRNRCRQNDVLRPGGDS